MVAVVALLAALTSGVAEVCPPSKRAQVVVSTSGRSLHLCADGRPVRTFGVRLGRGGMGKSAEGDRKVPIGRYSLGRPRRSQRYGMFIPIGYPTPEQRRKGLSGGAVGIHGPDRRVRWLGRLVNLFDTTDGCIGISTDQAMNEIAAWMKEARPDGILIQ